MFAQIYGMLVLLIKKFEEILMKNMSEEKATETIDKYIEKNSIIEIQVNPEVIPLTLLQNLVI